MTVDGLKQFIRARHAAWWRRVRGITPWTHDPTLARARFTNMYRSLDRGTLFQSWALRADKPVDNEAAAREFMLTVAYRVINRVESFLHVAPYLWPFDRDMFLVRSVEWIATRGAFMTGAYIAFRNVTKVGGPRKGYPPLHENLADLLSVMADNPFGQYHVVLNMAGRAAAMKAIMGLAPRSGVRVGPFTAHQILLDLVDGPYPLLPLAASDDWVYMGNGSKSACRSLGLPPTVDTIRALVKVVQPPARMRPRTKDGEPINMGTADVEHALCEYHKYSRIANGGHSKGTYAPRTPDKWVPPAPVSPWMEDHYAD